MAGRRSAVTPPQSLRLRRISIHCYWGGWGRRCTSASAARRTEEESGEPLALEQTEPTARRRFRDCCSMASGDDYICVEGRDRSSTAGPAPGAPPRSSTLVIARNRVVYGRKRSQADCVLGWVGGGRLATWPIGRRLLSVSAYANEPIGTPARPRMPPDSNKRPSPGSYDR